MFIKLVLLIGLFAAILMPVSANAWDCTPWGCGCPGPEELWEGECQIMPAEPGPLPQLFLPLVSLEG